MNRIVAFYGSDHKLGTTQIAQCCAEYIARKNPDLDVLLVLAGTGRGGEYCSEVRESLESIRPYVAQSILNREEIKSKAKYKDNLYILGGNDSPQSSALFTPDLAESFLAGIRDDYNLIIIDAGSDTAFGGCLGAIFSADKVYMVLKQTESSMRGCEWQSYLFDKIEANPDKYIINFYNGRSAYDLDYISERLCIDINKMLTVRESSQGQWAETNCQSLLSAKGNRSFTKDIAAIAEDVLDYVGIQN